MKAPRRLLDEQSSSLQSRLLRSMANEPLPDAALERAAKRFGVSAALLGASAAGIAQANAAQMLTVGVNTAATTAVGSSVIVLPFLKALALGLGLGVAVVGTVQWAIPEGRANGPGVATVATSAAPRHEGTKLTPVHQRAEPTNVPTYLERSSAATKVPVAVLQASTRVPSDLPTAAFLPESSPRHPMARFEDEPTLDVFAPREPSVPLSLPEETQSSAAQRSSHLAREVRALDSVREALSRGEVKLALERLNDADHGRVFRMLRRESLVLRVEALGELGRTQEADSLARSLMTQAVSPSEKRLLERWLQSRIE